MTKEKTSPTRHAKQSRRDRREAAQRRNRRLMIGGSILAIALVGAFALRPRPQAAPISEARLADDPSLGSPTAKVTIVEYGDFGCPSCRAWHRAGILDQVRAKYGNEVRFVWRDFAVITPQSPKAAEAAQCAYDQKKFWEYHDLLYDRAPALSVGDLKSYASEAGLDTASLLNCAQKCARLEKEGRALTVSDVMGLAARTWADLVCGREHTGRLKRAEFDALGDYLVSIKMPPGGWTGRPALN